MYYHAAVLLLFRPFLRAKFTESNLVPADICRRSANAISELFSKHLALYENTGIYTFQIQCLLAACTIHLINLPAIAATTALRNACDAFYGLVSRNTWAFGSIKLIKELVTKWNIILPGEVDEALYKSHKDLPATIQDRFDDPTAPQAEITRGTKRATFLNPSQTMQKRAKLAPVISPITSGPAGSGNGSGSGSSSAPNTPSATPSRAQKESEQRSTQSTFLFAPFPNQPAPLLGPVHTSTMADTEWSEELSRVTQDFDGLKFEGNGWFDPFMGI
jgi:hypothetical protein